MIIAFLSIVAIFTILGNLFVILCVLLKDQLRRVRSNMFVVSLGNQYELHNDTYENHKIKGREDFPQIKNKIFVKF